MTDDKELAKLKNKVELLTMMTLETDVFKKGLYAIALNNEWSMLEPGRILLVMNEFACQKQEQTYSYEDIEKRLQLTSEEMIAIMAHFSWHQSYMLVVKRYLETFLQANQNAQNGNIATYTTYQGMLADLMGRMFDYRPPLQGIRRVGNQIF